MAWQVSSDRRLVYSDLLASAGVRHGVTTRIGELNLSFRVDADSRRVAANRADACAMLGAFLRDLTVPEMVHGTEVAPVEEADRGTGGAQQENAIAGADALVTDVPGLVLGATVADCLAVFLVDMRHRSVGLAHSGWRGTAGGIAGRTLALMRERYGTDPADVVAAIGPGIGGGCYEIGDEVRDAFPPGLRGVAFARSGGRWKLDLCAAVGAQLVAGGVRADRIDVAPWCTHCETDLLFSHRREGGTGGRMIALLSL